MSTKITIQNESRLPMAYLMRRLALDMRRPASLETAVKELSLEESTIDRSLSIGVCRSENNVAFVVKGLGAPDPSRPIKVEVHNGTLCPDYIILEDAAKLYGKHQENFLLGCDATDYIKDESTEALSRTLYLDNTMRNGVVTISFWDKLEPSLSMALDALKKQVTNWKEVPQAIEAIEAIYRKAKDVPCRQENPIVQESARKPLAAVDDIVSFRMGNSFSPLLKVRAITADAETKGFTYKCAFYYPEEGRCSADETTTDWPESDLSVVYDRHHINECRDVLNAIRELIPQDDVTTSSCTLDRAAGARCPSGMHISITTQYKRTVVNKGDTK